MPDEPIISGRLAFRKIPSQAWQDAHPGGMATEPPGDEDMVIQCVVLGAATFPSKLTHPKQWPMGQVPLAELSCHPYLEFIKAAKFDIARQKGEVDEEPVSLAGTIEPEPAAG